jgi:hypothetical protein
MKRLFLLVAAVAALGIIVHGSAFAADHAAVGAEKCGKMCHKVEFESWAKSKHATAKEKVECETCHGNGADYMKLSVMKDKAKAKELGLIAKPDKAGCTAKCHKPADIKDDMLAKVHDHKVKS